MSHPVLRILGLLSWIAIVACAYAAIDSTHRGGTPAPSAAIVRYFAGPTEKVDALDRSNRLRVNDPIFLQSVGGHWSQIGYVASTSTQADESVVLAWYSRDVAPQQCRLVQYRNSGRLEDVVATMLPPEKRLQIQQRLATAMSEHGDELSAAFVPLVETSLRRSLPVIEEEFRRAVEDHRAEIDQLGQRWNDEVVGQRLIPLARREIIPIVRQHGEPTAEQIGRELWDRASIWRFGWRAVYDKSPLPRKDLLQEEWDRFVVEEAVPVFERQMDEIVVSVQRIVADVAASEAVRRELADVAGDIASDPETRRLVREILKQTLVDNDRLREVFSGVWTSDEARRALDLAGDRLEPVVRQIGDDLFGTQEDGINPNFARVLRSQILGKDRRWIVAEPADNPSSSSVKTIEVSGESMPYPVVYMADREIAGGAASSE